MEGLIFGILRYSLVLVSVFHALSFMRIRQHFRLIYVLLFYLCFNFYFRWSYGIVMWEIATLGKIPTSTYFAACVTFSLQREGGGWGPSGPFLPHSPRALYRLLCSPQLLEPLVTFRLLKLHLA